MPVYPPGPGTDATGAPVEIAPDPWADEARAGTTAGGDSSAKNAAQNTTRHGAAGKTASAAAHAANRQDPGAADASRSGDFATLLAGSVGPLATAVAPDTSIPEPTSIPADATTLAAAAALPAQLLALLSGNWAQPTVGGNAAGAPASSAATLMATALPGMATGVPGAISVAADHAAASVIAGLTGTVAPVTGNAGQPGAAAGHASADGIALPASAALTAATLTAPDRQTDSLAAALAGVLAVSADAGTDAPGVDAVTALDTSDIGLLGGATPVASPVRAAAVLPAVPLALPADLDAGFDDGFGTRIAWMAEQRVGHAEIRLNPANVGPIEVRVQLDGTRVNAEFHSAHAEVRQALEASLPRLREMLGQHGLQLGQADIGQRQPDRRGDPMLGHGHSAANEAELEPRMHPNAIRTSRGLLDEYA